MVGSDVNFLLIILPLRFSRTLHVLSELEQEKKTWRLIGSLYSDRINSMESIPTMDMELDSQVRFSLLKMVISPQIILYGSHIHHVKCNLQKKVDIHSVWDMGSPGIFSYPIASQFAT